MRKLAIILFLFAAVLAHAGRHYTVIVSMDGFRWDYPLMYDTPFLDSLRRSPRRRSPTTIRWPRASCPTATA